VPEDVGVRCRGSLQMRYLIKARVRRIPDAISLKMCALFPRPTAPRPQGGQVQLRGVAVAGFCTCGNGVVSMIIALDLHCKPPIQGCSPMPVTEIQEHAPDMTHSPLRLLGASQGLGSPCIARSKV
jgi:hypothetical protein